MLKVMIVDDEKRTRLGLVSLISWESYGFKVVDTASNGTDALRKFKKLVPNLMIIDMKMPGMSGIELVEQIRKMDRSTYILILSGHAEFEYAKKAIKLNVTGYMLKPIEEEELINYLVQIKEDYQNFLPKPSNQNQLKKQVQMIIECLNHQHCNEVIDDFFQKELQWKSYRIILLKIHQPTKNEIQQLVTHFNKILTIQSGIAFPMEDYIGILLADHIMKDSTENIYLEKIAAIVQNRELPYNLALSEEVRNPADLSHCYQATLRLIQNSFFYEETKILTFDSIKVTDNIDGYNEQESIPSLKRKLCYAVDIAHTKRIQETCWEIAKWMVSNGYDQKNIVNDFIKILSFCVNHLILHYPDQQNRLLHKLTDIAHIIHLCHLDQLIDRAYTILLETVQLLPAEENVDIVKKMIVLIERNFYQNLKLETLADVFKYHRVYLGQLFKDYTGEYFNTYLDKVRIENSKKLILKGYKVYQVAEQVGYSNADYFHSKFKKYVGMSPSVFKKNYSQK